MNSKLSRLMRAGSSSRYACELLLERRLWFFIVADVLILFQGLMTALQSPDLHAIYYQTSVFPLLVLGLPAMSAVVALERRSGSLDLALAVPSTERYFVRRVAPVGVFLVLQGWITTGLAVLAEPGTSTASAGGLVRAMVHNVELAVLLVCVTLFWAGRLKGSGAVLLGSAVTVVALSRWINLSPFFFTGGLDNLLGIPRPLLAWFWNFLVLALASVIFYLYARERLRRPEAMLA